VDFKNRAKQGFVGLTNLDNVGWFYMSLLEESLWDSIIFCFEIVARCLKLSMFW